MSARTRREILGSAGAAATGAILFAPGAAQAKGTAEDAALLLSLLKRERRLAAVYAAAAEAGLLGDTAIHLRDQEREHARGLERGLAGMGRRAPGSEPRVTVPSDERSFARLALRLEGEAVAAYLDAIARVRSGGLLRPLGSIAASEGQHEVILRRILGLDPLAV